MSITKNHNLLVTLENLRKVEEYTSDGHLVRKLELDCRICQPQHCVELSTGQLVISHCGHLPPQHRVCIVTYVMGRILISHGGTRGSGAGQLNTPRQLAVDKHDNVFVIDWYNDRTIGTDSNG